KRASDIRTTLADIPGLGPARIRELLQRFGSVARLRAATVDELAAVPGIGPTTAEAVRRALRDGG
ncbi:MAG: hypothetical protein LDL15_06600, partial [Yonghaparkia sp.]|nr:hypothetical protein [Microcella sp.]